MTTPYAYAITDHLEELLKSISKNIDAFVDVWTRLESQVANQIVNRLILAAKSRPGLNEKPLVVDRKQASLAEKQLQLQSIPDPMITLTRPAMFAFVSSLVGSSFEPQKNEDSSD